jgi:DNA repair exonuclease SbcCD ATPase subunit
MELVSLEIERFGCVARAHITFKPGLNVLHGANEIGKSSIARAIRFALLLPSSSSAVEPWIPWSGGGDPTVTLVFRNGSTEYYRVKKVFGTNTASLERSSDGAGWANLARAREVEARLRALLQWGVPEPGGAKAPKGLPESFLASALLADQDEVASIFEQDLDSDGFDSGRVRLRAALQAMAQDPLFKTVLDTAQARVDEAFTPSGQRKRGAGDPFKKLADDVASRQRECDEAEQAAGAGRLLAQRVTDLQRDAAAAEGDLQEKTAQREALEERRTRQRELATAAAVRKTGQVLVDAVSESEKEVKTAEDLLQDLRPRIPDLRKREADAREAFKTATADASAALEKRKGELAQEETAILRARDTLRMRQARVATALDLRKADELRGQGDAIEGTLKALDSEISALESLEPWTELRAARTSLDAALKREEKVGELLSKAAELRSRASTEWPTAESKLLPDEKRLAELLRLRRGLDVAEAKLDVGLSVEVRGAASVMVSVDGAAQEARTSPFFVEANAAAQLDLGGDVEILIRGGRAADRDEAERQRKEWREATASLFVSVGVADFPALEEACRVDAERRGRAEALVRDAGVVDAERTALGDPTAERERLSARIVELERRLEGADMVLIEAAAKAHGTKSHAVLTKTTAERESNREALAKFRAQDAALRERVVANANSDALEDVDAEMKALAEVGQALDRREKKIIEERRVLDAPPGKHDALEEAATKAKNALDDALERIASATRDSDSWSARLQERRRAAEGINIEALKTAEESARAATIMDGAPVDEAAIISARKAEETAKTRHEALVSDLRKAEGALHASGGAAADERARDLEAALQRAHEKQADLEDEYEAWKLLAETLKEAERSQATHLGNVLAPDLAARLQALVGQRYSGIALSPHLGLEGIDAAGGRRGLERLSIGTREQLSTLFRLCLAERLRSALLLDDQLVQSDPDRLRWFRSALRQTASVGVQIIVLTCRPDDYLEPAESPPLHVVDLNSLMSS